MFFAVNFILKIDVLFLPPDHPRARFTLQAFLMPLVAGDDNNSPVNEGIAAYCTSLRSKLPEVLLTQELSIVLKGIALEQRCAALCAAIAGWVKAFSLLAGTDLPGGDNMVSKQIVDYWSISCQQTFSPKISSPHAEQTSASRFL